jgi:hypothetical protein
MMREEKVYQIIGWILLPITVLLMLYVIFGLLLTPNIGVLLGIVVIVGTLLYLIRSIIFLQRNILPNKPANRGIRRSIRLSAVFAAFFILNIIYGCVIVLSNQNMINQVIDKAFYVVQAHGDSNPSFSYAQIHQVLITVLWIALIYALLLLLHLLMSFLFLRRYGYLFEDKN